MIGRRSIAWAAVGVAVAAVGVAAISVAIAATQTAGTHDPPWVGPVPTAPSTRAEGSPAPAGERATSGATSVRRYGASGRGDRDDTRAFEKAMLVALSSKVRF